jgi:hypothetical protein
VPWPHRPRRSSARASLRRRGGYGGRPDLGRVRAGAELILGGLLAAGPVRPGKRLTLGPRGPAVRHTTSREWPRPAQWVRRRCQPKCSLPELQFGLSHRKQRDDIRGCGRECLPGKTIIGTRCRGAQGSSLSGCGVGSGKVSLADPRRLRGRG